MQTIIWCTGLEQYPEFSVTDIKHFFWCEAIVYITHYLGVRERETEYMAYGKEVEKESVIASIMRAFKGKEIVKAPMLHDPELGLAGAPDFVVTTWAGEAIPVEVKWAEPGRGGRAKRDHVMQLTAYALLIERAWRYRVKASVKRGGIYYLRPEGRIVKVAITYSMKKAIIKALSRMRSIARGEEEPKPAKRCRSCNYAPHCPYPVR